MGDMHSTTDLTSWAPTPTIIPEEWERLIENLVQQSTGMPRSSLAYALNVRYNSQRVGDLLRAWGLPWPVVTAGYLHEYDEGSIPWKRMPEGEQILGHVKESIRYAHYIEEEDLFPLITPPYSDLGALLIAIAVYYQALKVLQEQSRGKIPQGKKLSHIENIRRTLLHVAKYLGMWYFKREIEDLAEQLCHPTRFAEDQQLRTSILKQDKVRLEDIRQRFLSYYQEITEQPIIVSYMVCGIAGLKRRVQNPHTTATTPKNRLTGFDLVTFDIAVTTIKDCYNAFGVLSQLGSIQDRVSNDIAHPKPNGYSHISFGLILQPQNPALYDISWLTDTSNVCTLQIATQPLQAIMKYGCLYPACYDLYTKTPPSKEQLSPPAGKQFWNSREGRVYYAIQAAISATRNKKVIENTIEQDNTLKPMIVYDIDRNLVALPLHATALDFADEINISERAVEAIINNRPAPLYRELEAGDIVEIRTSQETQVQEQRRHLHKHRNYQLIHNILNHYHYPLTLEQLEEELYFLVTQHKLGTLLSYLERLDSEREPPWTPEWAAQRVMRRHTDHIDAQATEERHWVPVLLTAAAHHFSPRQPCGVCQPVYPHTPDIVGLVRSKEKAIIIHSVDCPRLANHTDNQQSKLFPMEWQSPPPAFKVAFVITAQDRQGLVYDLTKRLHHHQSILLSFHADAITRFKRATVRLTIETHDDREVLNIWDEMYRVEKVLNVEIDVSATLPHIHERLQHLHQQHAGQNTPSLSYWESLPLTTGKRPAVLKNPYDISRPATKNMFFGRTSEMNKLHRELCDGEHGKALVLYGPRRSGKSSLCKNFLERYIVPPNWFTFISLQGSTQQNEETILYHIAEAICETFHDQLHQPAPSWSEFSDSDPQTRFKRILQHCLTLVPGSRLILTLDEFGGALDSYKQQILEPRFFTYWRELISELPQLSLLFALPTRSHALLTSHIFPNAFSFTESLPLVYLDRESAERFLAEPLREQHIAMYPNAVAYIIHLTGGNPYYLALIGRQLISQLNQDSGQHYISEEDLKVAVERIIEAGSTNNFLFHRYEMQNEGELRVVEAIVDLTDHTRQSAISLKKIAEWLHTPSNEVRPQLERLRNGLILNEYRQERPSSMPSYAMKIELVQRWMAHNRWFFESPDRSA